MGEIKKKHNIISEEERDTDSEKIYWNPSELGFSFKHIWHGSDEDGEYTFIVGPMKYYNKEEKYFEFDSQINIKDKDINKICDHCTEDLYSFKTKKYLKKIWKTY